MEKSYILAEIRRTAAENEGVALGEKAFYARTGIKQWDWRGRYWARWSDALNEAGFAANAWNVAKDEQAVLGALATLTRELGRFPTLSEFTLRRRTDPTFPSGTVWRRLGPRRELITRLAVYCEGKPEWEDVAEIIAPLLSSDPMASARGKRADVPTGFVYLLKSGKHHKIGRTNAFGRRERELAIQLPEKANRVHVIETDDPVGIERYWHLRFADRRVRPDAEWFALTKEDIAAFKLRKFM